METLAVVLLSLALVVLVAALVIVLVARARARKSVAESRPVVDPFADNDADVLVGDPRRISVGDIVELRGESWAVRGTIRFTEGGSEWAEHLLDDAHGVKRWLSVEEDPDLVLALWTDVRGATVRPGPSTLDFDGRRWTSDEYGTARYTAEGTTGLTPTGTVRYHDYVGDETALLSFEEYGGSGKWEAARGERVRRHDLRVYAAR